MQCDDAFVSDKQSRNPVSENVPSLANWFNMFKTTANPSTIFKEREESCVKFIFPISQAVCIDYIDYILVLHNYEQ